MNKFKVSKVKYDPMGESFNVDFKGKNCDGRIWKDGSGSLFIFDNNKNDPEELFYMDHGKHKDRIQDLKQEIITLGKKLTILKNVYAQVSQINTKEIFKQ